MDFDRLLTSTDVKYYKYHNLNVYKFKQSRVLEKLMNFRLLIYLA